MADGKPPRDWSHVEVPSIPADDPIYSEGVIITFPVKPSPEWEVRCVWPPNDEVKEEMQARLDAGEDPDDVMADYLD